ncbi:MAG: DNA polymerase III subunit delta [Armatimonadetes bacterium]|nr:DNA polymerase III subunit delta [Armatimonadota bacterium]
MSPATREKKAQAPRVHLLVGEESLLAEEAMRELLDRLIPAADRALNLDVVEADEVPVQDIITRADTLPFFGDRRVVVVKRADALKAADQEKLADYLERGAPPSALILMAEGLDRRRRLYLTLKKVAQVREFARLKSFEVLRWVRARAQQQGKRLDAEAAEVLVALVGHDLRELSSELDKAVSYGGDRASIEAGDIRAVCSHLGEATVFNLVDALGNRQAAPALGYLHDILRDGEAPLRVLAMINRQFRMLLQARRLLDQGTRPHHLAQAMAVAPFLAQRYAQQAANFGAARFPALFQRLLDADLAIKTGAQPPRLALEMLIVDLCRA